MSQVATRSIREIHSFSVFEPDTLTSYQFSKVFRQKSHFAPEERLMFAVLTDAIECFQKYHDAKSRRARHLYNDAESWISSKDSKALFSFEQVCDVLGISPGYLRLGLKQWRIEHADDRGLRKRIREPLRYQYRVKNNRISI